MKLSPEFYNYEEMEQWNKSKEEKFSWERFRWCLVCVLAIYFLSSGYLYSEWHPLNPKTGVSKEISPPDRPPWWHWECPR